jgi:hypothetical protein
MTSVRTEISGGGDAVKGSNGKPSNTSGESDEDDEECQAHEGNDFSGEELSVTLPLRKASVISLTRTITQHTEPSTPSSHCAEDPEHDREGEPELEDGSISLQVPPPLPPLLARGLVLCLPLDEDAVSNAQYSQATVRAARAYPDFVVGFMSDEAWVNISGQKMILNILQGGDGASNRHLEQGDGDDYDDKHEKESGDRETYVIFAPLENDHVQAAGDELDSTCPTGTQWDDVAWEPSQSSPWSQPQPRHLSSPTLSQSINALHRLIARGISVRDAKVAAARPQVDRNSRESLPDILYIPVISMNV